MDGDAGHRLIANSKVAFPIVDSVRAREFDQSPAAA